MNLQSYDHIVLCVADVPSTVAFYRDILGMDARESRPDKWELYFGACKISLQSPETIPEMAKNTLPGTANFCLMTKTPIEHVAETLSSNDVKILAGPDRRDGAVGPIHSVYFHDPDSNLVEICNQL